MKKIFFLAILFFTGLSAYSQEFPREEGFYIGLPEINLSLSALAPEFKNQKFVLREADIFKKNVKREVNMMAMMEKERVERNRHIVELDAPVPTLNKREKSLIQVTNEIQMHNRGSNYDLYTGEKKIPAYQEMRAGLFNGYYRPSMGGRRYYSPYSPYSY